MPDKNGNSGNHNIASVTHSINHTLSHTKDNMLHLQGRLMALSNTSKFRSQVRSKVSKFCCNTDLTQVSITTVFLSAIFWSYS